MTPELKYDLGRRRKKKSEENPWDEKDENHTTLKVEGLRATRTLTFHLFVVCALNAHSYVLRLPYQSYSSTRYIVAKTRVQFLKKGLRGCHEKTDRDFLFVQPCISPPPRRLRSSMCQSPFARRVHVSRISIYDLCKYFVQ